MGSVTPARGPLAIISAGINDPGSNINDPCDKGTKAACKGAAYGSFFECSAQPIVSLATNELTRRGFLAFCRDSATFRNLFFQNEAISPHSFHPARCRFGRRAHDRAAPREVGRGECHHLRRPPPRGRSLHPPGAQRRGLEEVP